MSFFLNRSFPNFLPKQSTYQRDVDNDLSIYPRKQTLPALIHKLNRVEHTIEFTPVTTDYVNTTEIF